jgi:hypothetical protein
MIITLAEHAAAQFGAQVVSYNAGTTPAGGFTMAAAALGSPERLTGEGVFPGAVTPFNPPWRPDEIVSIGEGGWLTLRLSHFALTSAPGPHLGVFVNVGLIDTAWPNGQAGSPPSTFSSPDPEDSAVVEVSENGGSWLSLNGGAPIVFDAPTNGSADLTDPYSGVQGGVPSDFHQPFVGGLASFDGLKFYDGLGPDMLELLAGSGGGTWLDLSATGLAHVSYLRFSVPDDMNADTRLNFELDAVTISHAAVGAATVPEPATPILAMLALMYWPRRLRRAARSAPIQAR